MSGQQRRSHTAPTGTPTRASSGGGGGGLSRLPSPTSVQSPRGQFLGRTSSIAATEEASFAAAQELASVLNAPPPSNPWLAWSATLAQSLTDADGPPPPLPPGTLPEVRSACKMVEEKNMVIG